jgi:hypothetical protein
LSLLFSISVEAPHIAVSQEKEDINIGKGEVKLMKF